MALRQCNKNMLRLHGAVYYREHALRQSCVVVAGQVSSISILAQCLTSANLEQFLISGIQEQYLVSGTVVDMCPFLVHGHHQNSVYSSMSIVHINHCQYQR